MPRTPRTEVGTRNGVKYRLRYGQRSAYRPSLWSWMLWIDRVFICFFRTKADAYSYMDTGEITEKSKAMGWQ